MATIQLHGNHRSLFTTNVMACFHDKEIDYEFISVDFSTGAHKQPPFLALNPFGQVPAIKDNDFTLFESRAIIKYLAEKYEGQGSNLMGKTLSERAVVEQWCQVESQTFSPPCSPIIVQIVYAPMFGGKTDQAILDTNVEKLGKVLDVYEERLSKSKYLAGDFFSVADLSHLSQINCLVNVADKGDLITSRTNVNAWWERISSRPAWKKVLDEIKS
ncbi:glutathione S-transferase F10 [Cryptomeria japonica]|uniref:glutathione S-transferase F10 n=1 Tax=Cryptomeria japonica TaxID=3369 RepID=UPI0027DA957A|nr:glutathione S-transferase F10 [Cryptomeria japonica]